MTSVTARPASRPRRSSSRGRRRSTGSRRASSSASRSTSRASARPPGRSLGFSDDDPSRHDRQHRHVPLGHAAVAGRRSTSVPLDVNFTRTVDNVVTVGARHGWPASPAPRATGSRTASSSARRSRSTASPAPGASRRSRTPARRSCSRGGPALAELRRSDQDGERRRADGVRRRRPRHADGERHRHEQRRRPGASDGGTVHWAGGNWASKGFLAGQLGHDRRRRRHRLAPAGDLERRADAEARPRRAAAVLDRQPHGLRRPARTAASPSSTAAGTCRSGRTTASSSTTNSITRGDGLAWTADGYAVLLQRPADAHPARGRGRHAHDHRLRQRALPVRRSVPELRRRQRHEPRLRGHAGTGPRTCTSPTRGASRSTPT